MGEKPETLLSGEGDNDTRQAFARWGIKKKGSDGGRSLNLGGETRITRICSKHTGEKQEKFSTPHIPDLAVTKRQGRESGT